MQKNIGDFEEGDLIEGFYALRDAGLATAKSGKPYLRLTIGDATGSLNGNKWEITKDEFAKLPVGGVVKLSALVESYRDALQLRVEKIRAAKPHEFDPIELLPQSFVDLAALENEILTAIAKMRDPDYQQLLRAFFDDENFRVRFARAAAAKTNHHAWVGGLLEHTASMLRYAGAMLANNPARLNRDLLTAGIILHDVGKIEELALNASIEYSDVGNLIGHIVIGALMVEKRAGENFPPLKKQLLQHLILSHHGQMEFGAPVLPKIPEALALHHLDNFDAKTMAAARLIRDDTKNGNWTERSWMLDTVLFKGKVNEDLAAPAGGSPKELCAANPQNAPTSAVGDSSLFQ